MSNRMIKDSMLTSDRISALSDFEFRLWIGLILSVDDMGRGDARAAIIKGRVFPLRERVSLRDIEDALHGLAAKGCISLYDVGGRSYFWFPTWGKHQRIRDIKPRYPGPEEGQEPPSGNPRQPAADCGSPRPETKTKPNQNEIEPKDEDEPLSRAREVVGVVEGAVGITLSQRQKDELDSFVGSMGAGCVCMAVNAALDSGKPTWAYIRGVLNRKQAQGVRSVEDWDRAEASRKTAMGGGKGAAPGSDCQPNPDRVKECDDWMDEFFGRREGRPC